MKKIIMIKGTHCTSCKALIEEVCKEVSNVTSCEVDYKTGKTVIEYKDSVDWNLIKKEIEKLGEYKVNLNE